jgi:hypothetical protein
MMFRRLVEWLDRHTGGPEVVEYRVGGPPVEVRDRLMLRNHEDCHIAEQVGQSPRWVALPGCRGMTWIVALVRNDLGLPQARG